MSANKIIRNSASPKHTEWTLVAFLDQKSHISLEKESSCLPFSKYTQLPPHITILSQIFPINENKWDWAEKCCNELVGIGRFTLGKRIVWWNEIYRSFSAGWYITPMNKILKAHYDAVKIFESNVRQFSKELWENYMPHLTARLALEQIPVWVELKNKKIDVQVDGLWLLQHGGSFYGYKPLIGAGLLPK